MNIVLTLPNGEVYHIPIETIATIRTKYYAGVDGFEEGSDDWKDEFKYSMQEYVIKDWMKGNLDWEDIEPIAELQPRTEKSKKDYQKMFLDCDIEIY